MEREVKDFADKGGLLKRKEWLTGRRSGGCETRPWEETVNVCPDALFVRYSGDLANGRRIASSLDLPRSTPQPPTESRKLNLFKRCP